jgi:hypothetical protein
MRKFLLSVCIIFFSVLSINAQTINSISPNSGDQGQTLSVSISGTNMNYGSQWSGTLSDFRFNQWSGTNMFSGTPTSISGDSLYGDVTIPNGHPTGFYDLEVLDQNTGSWVMLNNAFYINITPCSGPSAVPFTKPNSAYWHLPENRDFITPTCELTRQNNGGLFNYVTQSSWNNNTSNSNIEYALGDYNNHGSWGTSLQAILGSGFGNSITTAGPITIHIIDDDLYFELDFTSWSSGQQGGFSYTRTFVDACGSASVSIDSITPSSGDQGQTLSVSISGTNMNYGSQWSGTLSDFRFSQWSGSNMFYGNSTSESGNTLL